MSEILLQTIVDKLSKLDENIQQVKNAMPQVPDYSSQLKTISATVEQLKAGIERMPEQLKFPTGAVHTLSEQLAVNNDLRQRPPRQEIKHQHHLNAGIIISGCLFMLLAGAGMWLFHLYSRLQDYQAGDIKYRYIQIRAAKPLHSLLSVTDSLYNVDGKAFRDSVLQWEQERERIASLLLEAQQKEAEAIELRRKANEKN